MLDSSFHTSIHDGGRQSDLVLDSLLDIVFPFFHDSIDYLNHQLTLRRWHSELTLDMYKHSVEIFEMLYVARWVRQVSLNHLDLHPGEF